MTIEVYHYQDSSSDKIWAINTKATSQEYTVWYGRRLGRLTPRIITGDFSNKIGEKLRKGYKRRVDMTIDESNRKAILIGSNVETAEDIPEALPISLWYRFSGQSDAKLQMLAGLSVNMFLDTAINNLEKLDQYEATLLANLPIVKALREGRMAHSVEYEEGPIAVLLIFALRRFLVKQRKSSDQSGSILQVADEDNEQLPDDYDQLEHYVQAMCKQKFLADGTIKDAELNQFLEIAQAKGLSKYTSTAKLTPIAIALGCINAPINLAVIQTKTVSAFF